MKKRINIFILLIMFLMLLDFNTLGVQATDSQFQPIEVTGFNVDLIAENSDGLSASTSTSGTFDTVVSGGNNVMYTTDFRGPLNAGTAPTYGLPSNGTVNSFANPGVSYKLADYNSNNALLLFNSGDEAALNLKTSGSYEKIIILASSANGMSTFDAILNFSDGTSYSTTFSVSDWYGSGSNYSIKAIGRVKRDNSVSGEDDGSFSGDSSNPRLYDCFIDLSSYKSKLVKSISIKKTSTTGRTAILAVAGQKPAGAPTVTTTNTASDITTTSFIATWDRVTGATSYCLDVATDENFTSLLGDYNNKDVGNVTSYSVTGLTAGNTYYYRVRAVNTNGASFSSNKTEITTNAAPASGITTTTTATITSSNSSNSSVSTNSGTRTTEVNGLTTDADSSLLSTLDIVRSTSGDVKKDSVVADKSKISEILQKVISLGKEIVQVYVEDIANDPADEVNVTVNADSLKSIADSNVNFEISTADLSVLLPVASINDLAENGNNLFFRIVPIKDVEEKATAVTDVKASRLILEAAGTNDVTILGTPMTIETNYQDTDTKVIFSLKSIQLPEDPTLLKEFLSNLGVYIYHSEDDQELQKGTIIYDTYGNPTGIEISINKFSTFTIVQFDNLANYLYKSHVRLGVIKSKSYAYKVANIFETQYNTANVTIEKKGIYYRIYMDFLDDAAGLSACQDMVNRKYIINYYFYNK